MKGFIEVTAEFGTRKILININAIEVIFEETPISTVEISVVDGESCSVKESYEEIKKKLEEAQ